MVRRCVTVLTLTGSLVLGGSAVAAPRAPAAKTQAASLSALAGCTASNARAAISKSGSTISGAGGFFGCTTVASGTLKLQRQRWYGWQTLDSAAVTFYPGAWYWWVSWNCAGSGTYTYRTTIVASTNGGSAFVRESSRPRWAC